MAALCNKPTLELGQINAVRPLVICLHGYLDNANSFSTLLPLLSEYQCIAIDLIGHGLSDHRPVGCHYHLADYAYDLFQLIEGIGVSDVILVGHSLGGIVCSIYASTKPSCLSGFIAIETIGPLSQSEDTTAEQLAACFKSRHKALGPIKQPKNMDVLIKARCAMSDLKTDQARTLLSRNIFEKDGKLIWSTDKNLRTQSLFRMTEAQAINILDNIECSRKLILGASGFSKIKQVLSERQEQFATVEVVEFHGGHHVHMDSPQLVASQILNWVQDFIKCRTIAH